MYLGPVEAGEAVAGLERRGRVPLEAFPFECLHQCCRVATAARRPLPRLLLVLRHWPSSSKQPCTRLTHTLVNTWRRPPNALPEEASHLRRPHQGDPLGEHQSGHASWRCLPLLSGRHYCEAFETHELSTQLCTDIATFGDLLFHKRFHLRGEENQSLVWTKEKDLIAWASRLERTWVDGGLGFMSQIQMESGK